MYRESGYGSCEWGSEHLVESRRAFIGDNGILVFVCKRVQDQESTRRSSLPSYLFPGWEGGALLFDVICMGMECRHCHVLPEEGNFCLLKMFSKTNHICWMVLRLDGWICSVLTFRKGYITKCVNVAASKGSELKRERERAEIHLHAARGRRSGLLFERPQQDEGAS